MATKLEVLIDVGEALRIVSGWTELEMEPDAIYLVPCKAVKLAPGLHVLRPAGTLYGSSAVSVKLLRLPKGKR